MKLGSLLEQIAQVVIGIAAGNYSDRDHQKQAEEPLSIKGKLFRSRRKGGLTNNNSQVTGYLS